MHARIKTCLKNVLSPRYLSSGAPQALSNKFTPTSFKQGGKVLVTGRLTLNTPPGTNSRNVILVCKKHVLMNNVVWEVPGYFTDIFYS